MDPYLALILAVLFLLSPAVPLATAWARLLPADDPDERLAVDTSWVLLLVGVTLCYLAQLPGVPLPLLQSWLSDRLPSDWFEGVRIAGKFLSVFVPLYAAAYAFFHRGPLRKPLLWAGILVVVAFVAVGYLLPFWAGGAPS
jgi:hypothetical protein